MLTTSASQATYSVLQQPVMWMFVALLVTFLVTRLVTRHIRSRSASGDSSGPMRNITWSGIHIHHQVFGIVIMLGAGLSLIAATPHGAALAANAAVFGVGASLTFDEFALWLHLKDVYWTTEGRQSVDAIFCVLMVTGLLIGGADLITGRVGSATWWGSIATLLIGLTLSVVCMFKGKLVTGIVGIVFQPIALIGAIRLAKPGSWWARRRYLARPRRSSRAERRFGSSYQQRWNRLRDLVAGAPTG